MKYLLFFLAMFPAAVVFASDPAPLYREPAKKIIKFGWDDPDPVFLEKNIEVIEQFLPYDGTGIDVTLTGTRSDGTKFSTEYAFFSGTKLDRQWFEPYLKSLKNTRFKKLKYNFINTSASCFTKEVDLFNDRFWESVCANFATMAWLAKEGGAKGIRFDLEDYGNLQLWRYRPECGHSYEEAWKTARMRGRQWMNAVAKEYPDITIFAFFWFDLMMGYGDGSPLLYERLEGCGTGLLVAFLNGIYDALPPNARIVDGMEAHGYGVTGIESLYKLRALRETRFKRFVAPENQEKFHRQTSLAVATYLSCYINTGKEYSFREAMAKENLTPVEFFRRNFSLAADYSDEYVWTWNECRKWYPIRYRYGWQEKALSRNPSVPSPYLGMALPGIEEAINYARDPWTFALDKLKKGEVGANLLKNPAFDTMENGKAVTDPAPDSVLVKEIPYWETWQPKHSNGKFVLGVKEGVDSTNAIKAVATNGGVIHQGIKVKPNGVYIIRAMAKTTPGAGASLGVQWKNSSGRWHQHSGNLGAPFNEDMGRGWKRGTIVIRNIPEKTAYMSVMLGANSAGKPEQFTLFDNVEIFELFAGIPSCAPHLEKYMKTWQEQQTAMKRKLKRSAPKAGNLIPPGDFNSTTPPMEYAPEMKDALAYRIGTETYVDRKKHHAEFYRVEGPGQGFEDDTAALVKNASQGHILFHVDKIVPGKTYVVKARAKITGEGKASLSIYWKTSGKFNWSKGTQNFVFRQELPRDWRGLEEKLTVPEGIDGMTVLLNVSGQKTAADECRFDDVEVFPL